MTPEELNKVHQKNSADAENFCKLERRIGRKAIDALLYGQAAVIETNDQMLGSSRKGEICVFQINARRLDEVQYPTTEKE